MITQILKYTCLFYFLFLFTQVQATTKEETINELIDNSDLSKIQGVYETLVKHQIILRKREKSCSVDPQCVKKWTLIEEEFLKSKQAEFAETKKIINRLLASKFSEAQLLWLNNVYKTQLIKNFNNFITSNESAEPSVYMLKKVKNKFAAIDQSSGSTKKTQALSPLPAKK